MKFQNNFRTATLLAFAFVLMSFTLSYAQSKDTYSFKVHNKGQNTIKKLLVSQDGKEYKFFDIGDGIKPGETAKLIWDKSTNSEACEQFVKALFDDGLESPAKKFDFCKEDLELEFV
ncbi:MAG: hypothetical protein NVSMB56_13520 [Pyrinomonadaceae bacterium]